MPLKSVLRAAFYQTEKGLQRIRFTAQSADLPVLLGISFPKSGTHLLDQVLHGFANVAPYARRLHSFYAEYEGESGLKHAPDTPDRLLLQLERFRLFAPVPLPVSTAQWSQFLKGRSLLKKLLRYRY